jgi:aryl-alcohol dehydrogenase-like predicted oxidoreductase
MEKRKLGSSGLEIAPLVFGCNVFGWTVDEPTAFILLDEFVSAGFTMIDTADVYGRRTPQEAGGTSEEIIGKWLKKTKLRTSVILATKVGMEVEPGKKGLSKRHILQSAEDSLRRLQTDCIDLYQSHSDDPETPMEETLEAYALLIKQGKVRAIGASNFSAERLSQALDLSARGGFPRYQSLQPWYNLYNRAEFEKNLEPVCNANSLGVITYFSLAAGFLTGKYRSEMDLSKSPRGKMVREYMNERGFRILRALDMVAHDYSTDPASVALAWLLSRPGITAPIASATSKDQMKTLMKATRIELDRPSREFLTEASAYE